jgi:hypothetical protein
MAIPMLAGMQCLITYVNRTILPPIDDKYERANADDYGDSAPPIAYPPIPSG